MPHPIHSDVASYAASQGDLTIDMGTRQRSHYSTGSSLIGQAQKETLHSNQIHNRVLHNFSH